MPFTTLIDEKLKGAYEEIGKEAKCVLAWLEKKRDIDDNEV